MDKHSLLSYPKLYLGSCFVSPGLKASSVMEATVWTHCAWHRDGPHDFQGPAQNEKVGGRGGAGRRALFIGYKEL